MSHLVAWELERGLVVNLGGIEGTWRSVAHDVSNILGVVMNHAHLAAQELQRRGLALELDGVMRDLGRIEQAAAHGGQVIAQISTGHDGHRPHAARAVSDDGRVRLPSGLRVLVVDDDEYARQSIARTLRSRGVRASSARDADQALDLLGAGPYDVLVTDSRMPGCSGEELAGQIAASHPRVHVVLMSGADLDTAGSAHGLHVTVLHKPFDGPALLEAIATACAAGTGDSP